jgi:alpha-glucosidase
MQPKMQYVDEFVPEELTLHIYRPTDEAVSELYEDDGITNDHLRGISSLKTFTNKVVNGDRVQVTQHIEGIFETGYRSYRLILHGFAKHITQIMVDDRPFDLENDALGLPFVNIPKGFKSINIDHV